MKTNHFPGAAVPLLKLLALCLAISACGGGGGGDEPPPTSPNLGWITVSTITYPDGSFALASSGGPYTTQADNVRLVGTVFVSPDAGPTGGTDLNSLSGHYHYPVIDWQNAGNGTEGQARNDFTVIFCYLFCHPAWWYLGEVRWSTSIDLAPGANRITVRASDPSGNTGETSLTITRQPETVPPTVSATDPANGADG